MPPPCNQPSLGPSHTGWLMPLGTPPAAGGKENPPVGWAGPGTLQTRRETLRYSTWQAAGESHLSKHSHPIKCLAAVGQDKLKKPDQFSTYQVLFRRPSETLKVPPFLKLLSLHNLEVTLAAAGPSAFRRKPPLQSCLFVLLPQISNNPSVGLKRSAHSCSSNGVGART